MLISELSRRAGISTTALRFYESIGLLTPARTHTGYRDYDDAAITRLEIIAAGKRLGLRLDDIAMLLLDRGEVSCTETKATLRPRLALRHAELQRDAAALLMRAAALEGALARLDAMPESGEPCGPQCLVPIAAEPEFACGLTDTECAASSGRFRDLVAGAERTPLPDGVRLTVPVERTARLAEIAVDEAACCPFLDIRLHVAAAGLEVEIRAPEAAQAILAELAG